MKSPLAVLAGVRSWARGGPTAQREPATIALVVVGVAGLSFRLLVARWSHGSDDINAWASFCRMIEAHHGVGWLYDHEAYFTYPPLIALLATALHEVSLALSWRFDFLFKVAQIGADALAAAVVYAAWRNRGRRLSAPVAFALFCWNPASFLISAHHGNTDPTCAALALLAALLLDRRRPFWGGLALAAAINVKLIPVLLVPAFLSTLTSRRQVANFLLALSLGAIPFVPFVVRHWSGFYAHVLRFRSFAGTWGLTSLFEFLGLPRLTDAWTIAAPPIMLLAPVALAEINRREARILSATELGATVFALFLALTPGFGVQYVIYPIPLLFAANVGWASVYSASSGLFLAVAYYATWTGTRPYFSNFNAGFPVVAKILGCLPWVIITVVAFKLPARTGSSRATAAAP
jgi:hypothetical protein